MSQKTTSNQDSSQDWTFKTEEEIKAEQDALAATATSTDFLVFRQEEPANLVVNLTPNLTMQFHHDNKIVGTLDWSTGKFQFVGEADESAQAFLKAMKFYIEGYFHQRISEAQCQMAEYMEHFK